MDLIGTSRHFFCLIRLSVFSVLMDVLFQVFLSPQIVLSLQNKLVFFIITRKFEITSLSHDEPTSECQTTKMQKVQSLF